MKRKGLMTQQAYRRRAIAIVIACAVLLAAIPLALPSVLKAIVGLR